jgi:CheY-like chemotaxis protein
MVMLRHPNPPLHSEPDDAFAPSPQGAAGRLTLLLSSGDYWREDDWASLLPRLLEPLGISTVRVGSGREATSVLKAKPVHIAVVDLALPLDPAAPSISELDEQEGGYRLLEMLGRLPCPPPTLVVKRRKTRRDDARELQAALQARAFAVIERPVRMEIVLEAMRRVLTRYHSGKWPGCNNN